ncbi:TetR/AcrR family transcriptional regulator [Rhizobium leguminosarum]|uniref:TetR/AcrR family transcriptional regulator n=1 Tax=Rhizobium leguminosarum TaxID=384 RepID=UPI001C94C3D0|nr:TetR/AcrR family transcriptional regulator [Rhizobium leguminosarum]MBY5406682.1 TetR/AcrR family transcriptional regulator [Rhizobium leguminosarum]
MVGKTKQTSKRTVNREPAALGRPSARRELLDVAIELIMEGGVEALTFEGLASRSGFSKGGILYHFPNRDELNRAVREHVREKYRAARFEATESLPDTPSKALKGWAIAALHNRSNLDAVSAKIMTSGLWDRSEGLEHHRERFSTISKGVGFERSALVYLATEGLWFLDLAGFTPFSEEERSRVVEMLLSIADGSHLD